MDDVIWGLLGRPFFTRAEALDFGWDDRSLATAVRQGVLCRVCRGYYVDARLWRALDDLERYRIRCLIAQHALGPAVALSHVSALVMHGIATYGVPLDNVHVTRLDGGASRSEAGVVHHRAQSLTDELVELGGGLATPPHRAAVEASTLTDGEGALVHFDSLLFSVDDDHDKLMRQIALMNSWPNTQHLLIPARMAVAGAQSPGESRGRWLFWRQGLPIPECQYKVYDDQGQLIATTDWGWPGLGVLGEFDGEMKYGRLLKPGQDPGDVVFAEKQREDLVRDLTSCTFIRLIWRDYYRPRITAERVSRRLGVRHRF